MTIFKCHTIFDHVRKIPENTKIISYKGNPSVFRSLLNYIFNMCKIPENTNRSSYWNSRPKIFWKCNYFETFTEVTGKFFVILHFEKAAYFFFLAPATSMTVDSSGSGISPWASSNMFNYSSGSVYFTMWNY